MKMKNIPKIESKDQFITAINQISTHLEKNSPEKVTELYLIMTILLTSKIDNPDILGECLKVAAEELDYNFDLVKPSQQE